MSIKLRNPHSPFYPMNYTPTLSWQRLCRAASLALFTVVLSACSTTRPPVVDHYSNRYSDPQIQSRGLVAMSDQEARKQRAGTTKTRQTASGQVISKNGQIKKQTSVEEVVIETQVTTVIDAIPVPTSDQDVR
jgi:hypothetical protein